jgi:hypothetical protein
VWEGRYKWGTLQENSHTKQAITNSHAATAKIGSVKAASRWNLLGKRKFLQTEMKGVSFS